jgi:hypothetical protein
MTSPPAKSSVENKTSSHHPSMTNPVALTINEHVIILC